MTGNYKTKRSLPCRCYRKWHCRCMVPRRKKSHPPFNSGTRSDCKLGLHPQLKALFSASPAVGSYDPRQIDRKSEIVSWKKQQESEEFSAMMGKLIKRKIQKGLLYVLGPGSHEVSRWPENTFETPCKNLRTDINFGTVPRFQPHYKSTTPGPGYTFRTHNPYYYLDQARLRGFSRVPSFEFDGLAPRFKKITRSWSLPCNRYSVKHPNSLQAFLEKVTSKRGPYDLFTGPRDDTTIKGYWTPVKLENYDDWPLKLPSEIERLSNSCNYFKGKWSTNPRFTKKPVIRMTLQDIGMCYKDPDEPGPGHYDPRIPQKSSSLKKYPFDSNIECVRPLPPSGIRPAPGRYKIKEDSRIKGHGWTCVFKSKVPRTIGCVIPSPYSDF